MAKLPGSFNTKEHEKMGDFSVLPEWEYLSQIVKSEMKPTKDKAGERLVLLFKVLKGKFKGRTVEVGLNLVNKNDETVRIANIELATISEACDIVGVVEDSNVLHGIPLVIKTGIQPANAQYPAKTKIVMYTKYDGQDITDPPAAVIEQTKVAAISSSSSGGTKKPDGAEDVGASKRPWD